AADREEHAERDAIECERGVGRVRAKCEEGCIHDLERSLVIERGAVELESWNQCPTPIPTVEREEIESTILKLRQGDNCVWRSGMKAARSSAAKSSGCSHAAKCPPLSTSWKYVRLGYARRAHVSGGRYTSSGQTVMT